MAQHLRNAIKLTVGLAALGGAGGCGSDPTSGTTAPLPTCLPGQTTNCVPPQPVNTTPDSGSPIVTPQAGNTPLPCDVQTLLLDKCGTCHGAQLLGGAPMHLQTWEDLQADAGKSPLVNTAGLKEYQAVLQRVQDNTNPMPQPPFPRLSAADIQTLQTWVSAGAPARAATETSCGSDPLVMPSGDGGGDGDAGTGYGDGDHTGASDAGWHFAHDGGPDDCQSYYEIRAHGGTGENDTSPFMARSNGVNDGNEYHCFYFKPPYTAGDEALYFEPIIDNGAILHHWLLYGTDAALNASGTTAPCQAAEPGAYLLAGWAPGAPPATFPSNIGLEMPSGGSSGLILEVHYFNTTGKDQPDNSGVKLCTAPKNTRPNTAGISFTGTEGICIGPNASYQDPNPFLDDFGGSGGKVRGVCDPDDNIGDVHMFRIWPHMHKKGRHMKVTLHPKGGADQVIFDGAFDFDSQNTHKFTMGGQEVDEVVLHNGDTFTTECWYDNRDAPLNTTKIPFGEKTQTEMCYGFIWAWPVNKLITNSAQLNLDPINAIGQGLQPSRRCLNPTGIFASCNGLADYPGLNP